MHTLILFNPQAGPGDSRRQVKEVQEFLQERGWAVDLVETTTPGESKVRAGEAVRGGYEAVLAAGGDGTLNEAVNALIGTPVALGILPLGTGNVWAREIGVPLGPGLLPAAQALAQGLIYLMDAGEAAGRYFLLWAGAGFDAKVTREVQPELKKFRGAWAFVITGWNVARGFVGEEMSIAVDGSLNSARAIMVVISNIQLYAAYVRLAPECYLDDGLLEITVLKGGGFADTVGHVIRALVGLHLKDPQVEFARGKEIEIAAQGPVPVQVDGEFLGTLPLRFVVHPRALRVIVPRTVRPRLFQNPPLFDLAKEYTRLGQSQWAGQISLPALGQVGNLPSILRSP